MIKLVSTVGFIIINDENKILLIKKTIEAEAEKPISGDNLILSKKEQTDDLVTEEWMIPFGTVDDDEVPRDVITREIEKCLSCKIKSCDYFNLYFYNISDSFIKKTSYFYGAIEGEIKTKNPLMTSEWINLDKAVISKLNLMPEQKEALNDFINFFQDRFLEKME